MQWLTWAFLGAVTAETLTRLWLGPRHQPSLSLLDPGERGVIGTAESAGR